MGERLRDCLAKLLASAPFFRDVRATGAFVALDLVGPDERPASMLMKRYLEAACAAKHVLIDYTPDTVMLMPPLILADEEADLMAETLANVVLDFKESDIDPAVLRPPTLRGHR